MGPIGLRTSPAPRTPFRYEACWAASMKLGGRLPASPKGVSLVPGPVNVYITMENHHFEWEKCEFTRGYCCSVAVQQHSSTAHVSATSTKKHRKAPRTVNAKALGRGRFAWLMCQLDRGKRISIYMGSFHQWGIPIWLVYNL